MIRRNTIGNTAEEINLDFLHEQLLLAMKKIKISDGSIDKDAVLNEITAYYEKKFRSLTNDSFLYDFIDLFCGAGGLSIGLEQVGFKPIIAIDKDEAALRTYRFNRPWMAEQSLINEDIRNLVDSDIFPHVPVIVGGPPCQGFSIVNKHKKENDERNELYKFYVHAVSQSKPKIFLMENVEGILKLYDTIKSDFANVGYITCEPLVLSPKDFGFPQSRKRAFILGIMDEYRDIADELYSIFKETVFSFACGVKYTLGDAIGDLPRLDAKTLKNSTYIESASWGYTFAGFHATESDYVHLVNMDLPNSLPLLNHRSKYNNKRDMEKHGLSAEDRLCGLKEIFLVSKDPVQE